MRRIRVSRASAAPFIMAADDARLAAAFHPPASGQPLPGTLYLVPMPIGNPDDISLRGLQILRDVSRIAVESLAVSRELMAHWNISTPLLSYRGRGGEENRAELLSLLQTGQDVALICDAGTPGIADPCLMLVRAALQKHFPVVALPGPTAVLVALTAAGLPANRFVFDGFPPRELSGRSEFFKRLAHEERTIVLYEHAARVRATLNDLQQALGSDRAIALVWDMTRPAESWLRGTIGEVIARLQSQARRGEITIVIAGRTA